MYYFSQKNDNFVQALLVAEFGSAEPEPGLHYFGACPILNRTNYYEKCFNDKYLVLNPNTGTWCFLSAKEHEILQMIDNITFQSLQKRFTVNEIKPLEEFIFYLYIRNIITINGQSFIEECLFDDGPMKRLGALFIVEPTKRCNLHCSYCFVGCDNKKQVRMSKKSAHRIIELILATDFDSLTIEFSGGEALLGFDFIQYFVKELKKKLFVSTGKRVHLTMQTNATLLDEQKLEFFMENDISFSVSLDGAPEDNDATRKYSNGKGSYNDIEKAVQLIRCRGLSPGVISVLTNKNSQNYIKNLKFFKKIGINGIKLNPIFSNGRAEENWVELAISDKEILAVQQQYLDYLIEEADPIKEDNIRYMFENLSTCMRSYRCMLSCCGAGENMFIFAPDGNIFPCAREQNKMEYCLGHINDPNIQLQTLYKDNAQILALRSRKVVKIEKCQRCVYRRFCEGDCSLLTYETFGDYFQPHPRCEYYQGMYDLIFAYLSKYEELPQKLSNNFRIFNRPFL